MSLIKSCLEAFEKRLLKTDVFEFDNKRFPLNQIAKSQELIEREVTETVIGINDLRFALGVRYFANQINLWCDWDWQTLFQLGKRMIQNASELLSKETKKKNKLLLMDSWHTFRDQLVAAKKKSAIKATPTDRP